MEECGINGMIGGMVGWSGVVRVECVECVEWKQNECNV